MLCDVVSKAGDFRWIASFRLIICFRMICYSGYLFACKIFTDGLEEFTHKLGPLSVSRYIGVTEHTIQWLRNRFVTPVKDVLIAGIAKTNLKYLSVMSEIY